MRHNFLRIAVVAAFATVPVLVWAAEALAQQEDQSGRARVLVGDLHRTDDEVHRRFGQRVAEQLREHVGEFALLTAIDEDEVDDTLDQFDLDPGEMDLIAWRQVATHLNAQLVIWGEASPDGNGQTRVNAVFVDAQRGDEMEVPPFTVPGDGRSEAREAAGQIADALDRQVRFFSAVLNCQDYLASDQFDDARRNCDEALELNPESTRAMLLRGQVAMESGEYETAIEYLERVVEAEPANEEALQSLAYSHAQLENMDAAIRYYRDYLQFNPDDQDVRLTIAFNLAQAGGYEEAMQVVQDGLERDPDSAPMWRYLGDVSLRQATAEDRARVGAGTAGEEDIADRSALRTAAEAYERFEEISPEEVTPGMYRNMIAAYLQLDEREKAADVVSRALEAHPEDPGLWSRQADVYADGGNLEDAISAMDRVVTLDADFRNAQFKRGVFKLRTGDSDAALEDFRSAVEKGTEPDRIANQLFAIGHGDHFQEGRFVEAVEIFETALEFAQAQQLNRQVNFWTGYAYYRAGEELDEANMDAEECQPAREALQYFQEVLPYLDRAGDYQQSSQQSIRQGVEVYEFRQEQIIRVAC